MVERIMKGLGLGLVVLIIAGCTGSVGVRARSYVMDKERVDQEMQEGANFGYLYGTPVPEDRSKFKKTRKIYVLEFTKDVEETEEEGGTEETSGEDVGTEELGTDASQKPVPDWARPIDIPSFEDEPAAEPGSTGATGFTEYTVQKEDTLQKISKKFYDTYRKWPRIYEVNKDVIGDPNQIKPGITIRIPVEFPEE